MPSQTVTLINPTGLHARPAKVFAQAASASGLTRAADELHAIAERARGFAGDEAEIFEAHAAFAEDPELEERAVALIDAGRSAVAAVGSAFAAFRELLAASTSEYLAARAADL